MYTEIMGAIMTALLFCGTLLMESLREKAVRKAAVKKGTSNSTEHRSLQGQTTRNVQKSTFIA
jgi:hypothetical protein